MKKIALRLTLIFALLGVLIGVTPPPAHAIPSLNPVCWIADTSNPAVKANCKGHNWSWPHWGGGSKYDGPDRGCGGSNIYSDAWYMTSAQIAAYNYPNMRGTQGIQRSELVLEGWVKNVRRFRSDEIYYSWHVQTVSWVWYPGVGWMTWYDKKPSFTVICDMNNHVKR